MGNPVYRIEAKHEHLKDGYFKEGYFEDQIRSSPVDQYQYRVRRIALLVVVILILAVAWLAWRCVSST